jgi:hypothetical protein
MNRHSNRVAALERQRAAATPAAGAFTLADWKREHEAHRNDHPAARLAWRLTTLDRWPEDRRADMRRVWEQAAEVEKMLGLWPDDPAERG